MFLRARLHSDSTESHLVSLQYRQDSQFGAVVPLRPAGPLAPVQPWSVQAQGRAPVVLVARLVQVQVTLQEQERVVLQAVRH